MITNVINQYQYCGSTLLQKQTSKDIGGLIWIKEQSREQLLGHSNIKYWNIWVIINLRHIETPLFLVDFVSWKQCDKIKGCSLHFRTFFNLFINLHDNNLKNTTRGFCVADTLVYDRKASMLTESLRAATVISPILWVILRNIRHYSFKKKAKIKSE